MSFRAGPVVIVVQLCSVLSFTEQIVGNFFHFSFAKSQNTCPCAYAITDVAFSRQAHWMCNDAFANGRLVEPLSPSMPCHQRAAWHTTVCRSPWLWLCRIPTPMMGFIYAAIVGFLSTSWYLFPICRQWIHASCLRPQVTAQHRDASGGVLQSGASCAHIL